MKGCLVPRKVRVPFVAHVPSLVQHRHHVTFHAGAKPISLQIDIHQFLSPFRRIHADPRHFEILVDSFLLIPNDRLRVTRYTLQS